MRDSDTETTPRPPENGDKNVEIAAAKGRPMLTWVGKRPLRQVAAFPAQQVEIYDPVRDATKRNGKQWAEWSPAYPKGGLLFHGDNKEVLAHLLANGFRGKVKLVYIDPPFDSGADYVRKVTLRGVSGTTKIEGETYTLGEQVQYTDIWTNDNYLQFMYERLLLLKELLSDNGHLFLQADDKRGHYLKIVLDEVMGSDNYINDIIWHKGREGGGGTETNPPLPTEYQNIYLYAKSRSDRQWNPPRGPYKPSTLERIEQDEHGWFYTRGRMGRKPRPWEVAAGVSKKTYVSMNPNESREDVIARLTSSTAESVLIGDVWNGDIVQNTNGTQYPTGKPESLLSLIIQAGTNSGDLVLDCFGGSGTTVAVAQRLGRRWIGCDINKGAVQTTSKRLQTILTEQIAAETARTPRNHVLLPMMEDNDVEDSPRPAQLSFAVYRVNDYDLQVQHNEAVNLACEHIGITRTRADSFFDGTLGNRLVKIVPFHHPLTPLDLEEIKRELAARPDEERAIVVVCLGREIAAGAWLEDWNRLRTRGDVPNKMDVIELRTDPKYGKFFIHQSAQATLTIRRENGKILVEISDFLSPTVIERLQQQAGILKPQIDDWRAMVDAVMIDTSYDGSVFDVALSDVPQKKNALVSGNYELNAPEEPTTVAVKILDVLGEEVLVTAVV